MIHSLYQNGGTRTDEVRPFMGGLKVRADVKVKRRPFKGSDSPVLELTWKRGAGLGEAKSVTLELERAA